ncbi:MAG TPA: type I 3-dehydroquinate dehydratase [Chthoniobacterales bacterium]
MPDLFELRLDRLERCIAEVEIAIDQFPAPFIVTARHPREGGANHLSGPRRCALLLQFLSGAAYVDVELRSVRPLESVLRSAAQTKVRTIISFHDFEKTPSGARLDKIASDARSLGADIVKIATRTDSRAELDRLLDFFERQRGAGPLAVMGMGKLGRASRRELARRGSVLNYAHLGSPIATGQSSVRDLRRELAVPRDAVS